MEQTNLSPRKIFRIVQRYSEDGWTSQIHFLHGRRSSFLLNEVYLWPALFYISPNEEWMLRIQKTGSGDNSDFLYRLEVDRQRIWRMEGDLVKLGYAFLERKHGVREKDFYHTGLWFVAWNLRTEKLHFTIHGSDVRQSGKGIERELIYHLREHTVTSV